MSVLNQIGKPPIMHFGLKIIGAQAGVSLDLFAGVGKDVHLDRLGIQVDANDTCYATVYYEPQFGDEMTLAVVEVPPGGGTDPRPQVDLLAAIAGGSGGLDIVAGDTIQISVNQTVSPLFSAYCEGSGWFL